MIVVDALLRMRTYADPGSLSRMYKKLYVRVKGAGGGVDDPGKVKIAFSVVSDRGESQLPDAFYQIKKYCS